MLTECLTTTGRLDSGFAFRVLDVRDVPELRDVLIRDLAEELRVAHKDPARLRRYAERYGLAELERFLRGKVFATSPSVRNGDFGEVLAAALLRERDGVYLPIFKLRYREKRNWPMRLTDILGFRVDSSKRLLAVVYGEAKTRTTRELQVGCEGYTSLAKECDAESPEILTYVVDRLYDEGRLEEADQIEDFLASANEPQPRHHHITLLVEAGHWCEEILQRLQNISPGLPNLYVEVILVTRLSSLIEECFQGAAETCSGAV